jgi:hypothetical protein
MENDAVVNLGSFMFGEGNGLVFFRIKGKLY